MKKLIIVILLLGSLSYSCTKEEDWASRLIASWNMNEAYQFASCSSYEDITSFYPYKSIIIKADNSVEVIDNNDNTYIGSWNYIRTSSSITVEDAEGKPLLLTTFFDHIEFNWDSPNEYFTISTIDEVDNNILILKNPNKGGNLKIHFSKSK